MRSFNLLCVTNNTLTARNLLLAGRSRKPGFAGMHGGEKGGAGSEALTHGAMNEIEFLGKLRWLM